MRPHGFACVYTFMLVCVCISFGNIVNFTALNTDDIEKTYYTFCGMKMPDFC